MDGVKTKPLINEIKKFSAPHLTDKAYDRNNVPFIDKLILEPAYYFRDTFIYPDITKEIMKAFNYWIAVPEEDFEKNHEAVKLCQLGHLIFDDVTYEKKERGGKETAHVKFGVPAIINTYYFTGLHCPTWAERSLLKKAVRTTNEETLKINRIRYQLINLRERLFCPNEELYYKLCGNRGVLSLLPMELEVLMELYSKPDEKMRKLAIDIRAFLTIIDECRRISNDISEDITQGYFSYPVVHAVTNAVDDEEIIISIMRQRTTDEALLKAALKVIKGSGYEQAARQKLSSLKTEILDTYKQYKNPNHLMVGFFDKYLQVPDDFAKVKIELS